jgi:hypothetical protein
VSSIVSFTQFVLYPAQRLEVGLAGAIELQLNGLIAGVDSHHEQTLLEISVENWLVSTDDETSKGETHQNYRVLRSSCNRIESIIKQLS